jgi:hypothetical protein
LMLTLCSSLRSNETAYRNPLLALKFNVGETSTCNRTYRLIKIYGDTRCKRVGCGRVGVLWGRWSRPIRFCQSGITSQWIFRCGEPLVIGGFNLHVPSASSKASCDCEDLAAVRSRNAGRFSGHWAAANSIAMGSGPAGGSFPVLQFGGCSDREQRVAVDKQALAPRPSGWLRIIVRPPTGDFLPRHNTFYRCEQARGAGKAPVGQTDFVLIGMRLYKKRFQR